MLVVSYKMVKMSGVYGIGRNASSLINKSL